MDSIGALGDMTVCSVASRGWLRDEADGDGVGVVADDSADNPRPVAVVLGVIRGVDLGSDTLWCLAEGDVGLHTASPMRPAPLCLARRYQPLSGPHAERT
jgi:hypothetical protein